jgi:predicted DCC family thiol-disulfide oxidoreductase YuxK
LSVIFLLRPLYPVGIWLSILLHSGMLWFTGTTFTLFFYGMTAAMLVFVDWPTETMTVVYDGDWGFCNKARRFFERVDPDRAFRWEPSQAGASERFGITPQMARERAYLVAGGRVYGGFRAFRLMLLYNPAAYIVTYIVLAAPGPRDSSFRNVLVAILLVLFSPLFTPVGDALYRVLARNRHRLSSDSQCVR